MLSSTNYHYLLKYIVVGDSCVGKSNILLNFTSKKFNADHEVTIGVEFGAKNVITSDDTIFRVQIWDTAGQEQFKSITRSYYKNSVCAFLVYDITKKETFDNIKEWLKECQQNSPRTILIVLIGNKVDLENKRQVSTKEGQDFANEHNLIFFETSAKTGTNIENVFKKSVDEVYTKIKELKYDLKTEGSGIKVGIGNQNAILSYSLNDQKEIKTKKECCK